MGNNSKCRMILFKYYVSVFLVVGSVYSQFTDIKGSLIRINVLNDSIDFADTLGYWHNFQGMLWGSFSSYTSIFNTTANQYLIRETHGGACLEYNRKIEIENVSTSVRKTFCDFTAYYSDTVMVYGVEPMAIPIEPGIWLFDDSYGQGFIENNDYFHNFPYHDNYLIHIIGKTDSMYLVVCEDTINTRYNFYLMDLFYSPYNIDTSLAIQVYFPNLNTIHKIEEILPNYYLLQGDSELALYFFESDSFVYRKTLINSFTAPKWEYRNSQLFVKNNNKLRRYTFNISDTSFGQPDSMIQGKFNVDRNFQYAAIIRSDSLLFYNIDSAIVEKTWDISVIYKPSRPLINYPEIYLHRQKNINIIIEKEFQKEKEIYLQAYPNPFNSGITFSIYLHQSEDMTLTIYDINGRRITSLNVDNYAGENKIQWRAENLASGIYFAHFKGKTVNKILKFTHTK